MCFVFIEVVFFNKRTKQYTYFEYISNHSCSDIEIYVQFLQECFMEIGNKAFYPFGEARGRGDET